MSAIYSTSYVHVCDMEIGSMHKDIRIPMYWVLNNNVEDEFCDEFVEGAIYLGGGSGEHPALEIKYPFFVALAAAVVFAFQKTEPQDMAQGTNLSRTLENLFEEVYQEPESGVAPEFIKELFGTPDSFLMTSKNLNAWPLFTWAKVIDQYSVVEDKYYPVEQLFMMDVGWFLFQNLPRWLPAWYQPTKKFKLLLDKLNEILNDTTVRDIEARYCRTRWLTPGEFNVERNVLIAKGGKVLKNNKVVYGYSLADYIQDCLP